MIITGNFSNAVLVTVRKIMGFRKRINAKVVKGCLIREICIMFVVGVKCVKVV